MGWVVWECKGGGVGWCEGVRGCVVCKCDRVGSMRVWECVSKIIDV